MQVPCRWEKNQYGGFWFMVGDSIVGNVWKFEAKGDKHWIDNADMHPRYKTADEAKSAVESRLGVRRD